MRTCPPAGVWQATFAATRSDLTSKASAGLYSGLQSSYGNNYLLRDAVTGVARALRLISQSRTSYVSMLAPNPWQDLEWMRIEGRLPCPAQDRV